ncbi:HAMP domain-containing sensor histidine kinase [Proteiniborus sp. MB09-C3]|uniref:sensor histidine kinase n=1 Tax=Proteiniborus sp. MB09-C3 TaxID=3050072 RepID=UPI002553768B|nr:HAMP domain-containing sensor histidine kinase [Proteiniborus sp. MB09-C3]WIV11775.1 HAMP domain-containing sensor histidine kinase [Proteiniborus sp. MB09-C3]
MNDLRKSFDTNSLKFKLWTYFIFFAAIIMIILWLLQIVFLNTYYKSMKTNEIKKIGNALVEEYNKDGFEDLIYSTSFIKGIIIQVFNEYGDSIFPINTFGEIRPPKREAPINGSFIRKLEDSPDGKIIYAIEDFRMRTHSVVYGAILEGKNGEKHYLYINGLLEPIDSTTSVLKNQLIIVTVISLLLAIGLSFLIATKLSKPITNVTNSAALLAKGNYDVIFQRGDYTEINQLADTLNFTTAELSKTEELRRELIANVSHDLRTPLTLIKSYAEMIRDISGNNPDKRISHLKVIIDESDRLNALVNDMLDLSKIQSGINEVAYKEFDIGRTTKNILKRFSVLSDIYGYRFILNSDDDDIAIGDEQKIEQVIYNLISNAVNHTGEDKLITIDLRNLGEYIEFKVTDTGKGISEEEIPHIWDRYYSSGKTYKRGIIGSGLGLSIVKSILIAHDARFGVESILDKRSTFWFQLKAK